MYQGKAYDFQGNITNNIGIDKSTFSGVSTAQLSTPLYYIICPFFLSFFSSLKTRAKLLKQVLTISAFKNIFFHFSSSLPFVFRPSRMV